MDGATSTADDIPSLSGPLRVVASNEEYGRNDVTQYPFLFRKDAAAAAPTSPCGVLDWAVKT